MEDCPHMIGAVSSTTVKKKLTKEKKYTCQPCTYKVFGESNEMWCCLQCGNIGCGDFNAQNGDAFRHHNNVGESDAHSIVVHIEKDSKCWCFVCKAEIDSKSGHLKDIITLIKRNVKFPSRENKQNSEQIAIPLPPPMPRIPPPPVIETAVYDVPRYSKPKGNDRQLLKNNDISNYSSMQISDKPGGLTNLGNTCFMNSAIQCLASTRLLIPKLEVFGRDQELKMLVTQVQDDTIVTVVNGDEKENSGAKDSIGEHGDGPGLSDISDLSKPLQITLEIGPETMTGRLRQTIRGTRKYETSKYDSDPNESSTSNNKNYSSCSYYNCYRPGEVHELVAKNFRRGAQHDSHELLRSIVDMMKKDQTKAFRVAIMKHYGVKKGGEGADPTLLEMVKSLDEKVKHKTFVDEVFGGELMTTQTCLTCKHVKRSHEQFLDLSLPLRVFKHLPETEKKQTRKTFFDDRNKFVIMNSLEECLRYFTEPELLTGSNTVECENCHSINLQRIESGESPETVFPSLVASEKSSTQSSPDSERKPSFSKKQDERKKRRNTRQNKNKNRNPFNATETVEETVTEKEERPGPSAPMPLIEDHFDSELLEKGESEEPEKSCDGESSKAHGLDDYIVISSLDMLGSGSKRKIGDVDSSEGDHCMEAVEAEEEIPPLVEDDSQFSMLASSKQISESLQNLNLKMEGDAEEGEVGCSYAAEEDADFDLPAVDGIGGSASDEEEGNGIAQIDLGLPTYDKFGSFQLPKSVEEDDELEKKPMVEKPTTADEGFSEGENSMSVDNEATRLISQGPSASSSRNSLSDSDETSKSSSNDERQKATVNSRIPKVTKCPCSRQQSISCPPENLTIHFKRFQMSSGGYPTKINDHVNYPMILDLAPFCSRDSDKSEDLFDEDGQVLYSLYGIVEHSGSMNWGHYVAYVKSSECEKRWFHISDSSVSVTSYHRVTSIDAYILFYERIRGNEKTRRLSACLPSQPSSVIEGEKEDEEFVWNTTTTTTGGYNNFWDDKAASSIGIVPPAVDEDWDTDPTEFQGGATTTTIDADADQSEIEIPCTLTDWEAEADAGHVSDNVWNSEGETAHPDFSSNWSMPEETMKEMVTEWGEGYQGTNNTKLESGLPLHGCQSVTSSSVSSFVEEVGSGSSVTFHRADEEEEGKKKDEEEVLDLC